MFNFNSTRAQSQADSTDRDIPWSRYHSLKWSSVLMLILVGILIATPLLNALPMQAAPVAATADLALYGDALASGWSDWSWGTTRNLANTSPVHSGNASIAATITGAWAGLFFHTAAPVNTAGYDRIRFAVHGGATGGQKLFFSLRTANKQVALPPLTANTWTVVEIKLSDLGSPIAISDMVWQNGTSKGLPVFYLDSIALIGSDTGPTPTFTPTASATPTQSPTPSATPTQSPTPSATPTQSPTPSATPTATPTAGSGFQLNVNATANRHAISPYIYGINFGSETLAASIKLPLRRWGGNATTRYNWQLNVSNRANDWFYENIPDNTAGSLPDGSSVNRTIDQDRRNGSATLLTIPMIGWVPKSRDITCAFSVAKYGAQQRVDPYRPDCGNGIRTNGTKITGNDPRDTSVAITTTYATQWVQYLVGRYGSAANGGVKFYSMDNEPMLWNSTHRDVHPNPTTYDEMKSLTYAYAAAVKAADPTAQTTGPALWGWTAYFYSAADAVNWANPPDRNAHGGTPFIEWYLQQMKAYEQQHGVRILDYLDVHFYPQNGVALTSAGNASTQALRLRSTRALWDPTYRDESWIGDYVKLIPRLKDWTARNYPGTKTAVTEYNWGGLESLNGALTQADILGIFGREGLDMATLWDPPTETQPGAYAFRIYRNYDGTGKAFGETSVSATSPDWDKLAIYAAQRTSDGAMTIIVINKSLTAQTAGLSLTGVTATGAAQVYRYSNDNLNSIARLSDQTMAANQNITFPASSITLYVIPTR